MMADFVKSRILGADPRGARRRPWSRADRMGGGARNRPREEQPAATVAAILAFLAKK
jgi:hypothetical protein